MKHLLAAISLTATLAACGPMHVCAPTQTRCLGSLVEICNGDGHWQTAEDCAAVSGDGAPVWLCCPVPADELGPAGHACLPAANAMCPAEGE